MKRVRFYIFALTLVLSACASDIDRKLAEDRAAVPPINGGFSFKQYVTVKPGDKEVLGDEGVFYISPSVYTDEQIALITGAEPGKSAMFGDEASAYFHLTNTCFSAVSRSSGEAGAAAGYFSLVLTFAYAEKDSKGIKFRLYAWPDFWYDWHIAPSGDGFAVRDSSTEQAFGWSGSRIVVTPDPSVTLDTCLNYRKR